MKIEGDYLVFNFSSRPKNLFETLSQSMYLIVHSLYFDENGFWKDKDCYIGSGQYEIINKDNLKVVVINKHLYSEVINSPKEIVIFNYKAINKLMPYDLLFENKAVFAVVASAS